MSRTFVALQLTLIAIPNSVVPRPRPKERGREARERLRQGSASGPRGGDSCPTTASAIRRASRPPRRQGARAPASSSTSCTATTRSITNGATTFWWTWTSRSLAKGLRALLPAVAVCIKPGPCGNHTQLSIQGPVGIQERGVDPERLRQYLALSLICPIHCTYDMLYLYLHLHTGAEHGNFIPDYSHRRRSQARGV